MGKGGQNQPKKCHVLFEWPLIAISISTGNNLFDLLKVRGMRLMGGHNATAFLLDSSIDLKRSTKIFAFQKVLGFSIFV